MISAHVKNHLSDFLRGTRSIDDARQILALIDQSQGNETQSPPQSLVNEFDRLLEDLSPKIPGLAIDLEKLLTGDPIESDPLISQGNLALLRLDAVYHQTYAAWTKSGADLHRSKRITKAEDPAAYAQRTEKHERTEQNYPPDAQLLSQIVSVTLSAFRIQATLTHRREQLSDPSSPKVAFRSAKERTPPAQPEKLLAERLARSASEEIDSLSQPEASARNAASTDFITPTESLEESFDPLDEISPINGQSLLIRGLSKLSPLKGYNPLVQLQPPEDTPGTADVPIGIQHRASEMQSLSNPTASSEPREEKPVTANKLYRVSIANSLSAPPREPIPLAKNEPSFHQRE